MVMITLHLHHETCSAFAMPFFVKSRLLKTRLYSERVKFLLITAMFFKLKYHFGDYLKYYFGDCFVV